MGYLLMRLVRILMPIVVSFAYLLGFFFFNPMCCYWSIGVFRQAPLLLRTQTWRWLLLFSSGLLSPLRVLAWGCAIWQRGYIANWWVRMPHRFRCPIGFDGPSSVYAYPAFHDGCGIPIVEEWHPLYLIGFRWAGLWGVKWYLSHAFPHFCDMCFPFLTHAVQFLIFP